ncbi:unnamed protein product [Mycena citricolor]|uniref:Uncharacterized protein n=1 Tax=Mycena citricolor TaxID=2018698 RepID=A0AAD2Q536_9AGAR|nr:unnamed protein product [Mycena citricolor]
MTFANAVFFNPTLRIYALRLLILSQIITPLILGVCDGLNMVDWGDDGGLFLFICFIPVACFTLVHHCTALISWSFPGAALLDILLVLGELGMAIFLFIFMGLAVLPCLIVLFFTFMFRIASIVRGKERFFKQRFAFLGGCAPSQPRGGPLAILFSPAAIRPLMRGEWVVTIVLRTIALCALAVFIPGFMIYAIFFMPFSSTHTRTVPVSPSQGLFASTIVSDLRPFPRGFGFAYSSDSGNGPLANVSVRAGFQLFTAGKQTTDGCQTGDYTYGVQCPQSWDELSNVTFSMDFPSNVSSVYIQLISTSYSEDVMIYPALPVNPVLLPGSRLVGVLSWSQRKILQGPDWTMGGISFRNRYTYGFFPTITALQQNLTADPAITNPRTAQLTLLQPYPYVMSYSEDHRDYSALGGIGLAGGMWVFANGLFALFFGAGILHFGLGRRPLSPIGLLHVFQRDSLLAKQREDFPALLSENEDPAGVVALVRDRMVQSQPAVDPSSIALNNGAKFELMHPESDADGARLPR